MIKYQVEWTPWNAVEAAARAAGWTPTEGAGTADVSDFIDISDFDRHADFQKFSQARKLAWTLIDSDTWHCPRIKRLVETDGHLSGCWEQDAMWEIYDATTPVFEAYPDWTGAAE